MIWSNLLHLGYNMWNDREVPELPNGGNYARPYLRCDYSLWSDLTQQMANCGMNMLVIDLGEGIQYESHPELAVEGSWTKQQLKAELARLRQMGIEPIPKMNFATSHDAWLGPYSRMVSTPRYYELVSDLIAEACTLFDQPRFLHLGMDEETFGHQKHMEYAVVRQHDLWWRDLYFMVEQVEKAGVRPWVWSDALWHHEVEFLRKMPRSVLQSNWYYGLEFYNFEKPELLADKVRIPDETRAKAYVKLDEHGFDQIPTATNWEFDGNFERTVEFCRKHIAPERLFGFMTAPWHPTLETQRPAHEAAIEEVAEVICSSN
jgi:hypothetical protein